MFIKTIIRVVILLLLTVNIYAETEVCSSTTPTTIPNNNATGITDTINISDVGNITDLKILLDISHEKVSELNINLTHDSTIIDLLDHPGAIDDIADGCEGKNILNLTLADDGTKSLEADCTLFDPAYESNIIYTPNDSLSNFIGGDITGNWVLEVSDNNVFNNVDGALNKWCIKYNRESTAILNPAPPFDPLTFGGGVNIGESGNTQAELTGTGDKIIIYSADFTGANTSEFALTSHHIINAFEMEIPVNTTKTFTIECTPTQIGTRTANFNLYTNIPGYTTITYPLECDAFGGVYSDNATSTISFGKVEITTTSIEKTFDITAGTGADLVLSFSKGGSNSNNFSITQFPASPLAAGGGTGVVGVTCTPNQVGSRTAKIIITTNDPNMLTVRRILNCTGEGVIFNSTPVAEGETLEFGLTKPGEGGTSRNLNIGNDGNIDLDITNIAITGANAAMFSFSPSATSLTLEVGLNYDIDITCNPTTLGTFSATLEIPHTDLHLTPNPLTYDLSCSGTDLDSEPLYYSIPAPGNTINVGNTVAANSIIPAGNPVIPTTYDLNVKERGNADLTITSFTMTGANASEFAITNSFPITISDTPDDTGIDITIECFPPVEGLRTAVLTFATNDPTDFPNPSYNLECTGLVAGYDSSPVSPGGTINVGNKPINQIVSYNLKVKEAGDADLFVDLAADAITGSEAAYYAIDESFFPFTISNGNSSKNIVIDCSPVFIGIHPAQLNLTTNDPAQPKISYPLECTGEEAIGPAFGSFPPPYQDIDFGNIPLQTYVEIILIIKEFGSTKLNLYSAIIDGTDASDFSIESITQNGNLKTLPSFIGNGDADFEIVIRCTPSAEKEHVATLHIDSNDPVKSNLPYPLVCTGTPELIPVYTSNPNIDSTIDFGSILENSTILTETITITESGNTDLEITDAVLTGDSEFTLISPTFPLTIVDGGDAETVTLECNPINNGTYTAQLVFTINDPVNPKPTYDLTCVGNSRYPVYVSDPDNSINFGSALMNRNSTKTITITESGTSDLKVNSVSITGSSEFSIIDTDFPFTIADNSDDSQTIILQCNRNKVGSHTAQLNIVTNDPNQATVTYNLKCISDSPEGDVTIILPNNLTLTVNFSGDGTGKVESNIAGINCNQEPCSSEYEASSKVKLTATPNSDSIFERWGGNSDCTDAEVFLTSNVTCIAYFDLINQPIKPKEIIVEQPIVKPTCTQATEILYVNNAATGYDSGLNWQDAFIDVQDALEAARNICPNIKQIWIAQGTYYPTTNNDRDVSFELVNGIKIYGGFAGHEAKLEQQNCTINLTTMSGDIGVKNDNSDNSQHVVTANGVDRNTLLNCLIIADGNADECGGGMFNDHASPTLQYLLFENNHAIYGAGLCNINDSNPLIQISLFTNNRAGQEGGGIYNNASSPLMCNVFIEKNTGVVQGAGIANMNGSNPTMEQVHITENTSTFFGAGMLNDNSNPLITHSIISKNTANYGAGIANYNNSRPLIGHLILTDNNATQSAGAMLNKNSSPIISQSTIAFNKSGIENLSSFPTISNSILWDTNPIINKENSTTTITYSIIKHGWEGKGNKSSDPLFTQDNIYLQRQSQAIDAGNNDLVPQYLAKSACDVFPNDNVDFGGKPRVVDGNADGIEIVDMGVHEANFSFTYLLTVKLTGEGSGSVISDKLGINCGADCYHNYSSGIDVLLIATPNSNSIFNSWSGDCASNGNVKMIGVKKCQAKFDLIPTETNQFESVEDRTCSAGNVINTTCNFGWDSAEDILIEEKGNVSHLVIKTDVKNKGRIANVEITKGNKVTGGILSGYIKNDGTLADFEFLGAEIRGGKLVGDIVNNSEVEGIIIDVSLAPNTRITGGRLGGRIIGNANVPAILEDLIITDGTYLSNVIIGKNVISEGNVEYGSGVQFYFGTKAVPFEKTIVNEGTKKDLTFSGSNLSGGTLDGDINITMGGTISNVKLTAGTKVNGGNLKGKIIGDAKKPAILTNLNIVAGSYLENVIIGKNVYLPDDVKLGPNVTRYEEPEEEIEILPTASLIDKHLGIHDLFDSIFTPKIETGRFTYPNHAILTFEEAKQLKLSITIKVLPEDIGKSADMLVVVEHKDRDNPERNSIKVLKPPKWNSWDNDIFSLQPMQHYQQLPLSLKLPIYTGDLNDIAEKVSFMSNGYRLFLTDTSGEYNFYIGYRLPDNSIVYNGPEPLHLFVDTAPESCILYALHDDKLNDSQVVIIDLSAGSKGSMTPLGPMRYGRDMEGLAIHPDNPDLLFASAGNHAEVDGKELDGYLYTIHRETGDMTVIGPTGFEKVAGLGFNPVDRNLYAWGRNEGGTDKWKGNDSNWERENEIVTNKWTGLITINTTTGIGTPIKQMDYKLHDMGGLAWSFDGKKLYASGDEHLWVYDLDTQTFEIACDFVDDGRIEGLDTQPNGFLLVGVDRKGKNGRETRILAYDPVECKIVHKKVYKGLKYDDIESIVWPATECNDTSWLSDH
ncbi:MAG: choice-of-anchor D domain-containing protein [Candidatus Marithrix sp.]